MTARGRARSLPVRPLISFVTKNKLKVSEIITQALLLRVVAKAPIGPCVLGECVLFVLISDTKDDDFVWFQVVDQLSVHAREAAAAYGAIRVCQINL